MDITLIAAVCLDNAIGQDGDLICHLRPDMRHFRNTTMGHPVIMGRKTWESLGGPLPGRRNIVISRQEDFVAPGAEVFRTLHSALQTVDSSDEAFIIGGQQIYTLALPLANRLNITHINIEAPGADTFFPAIDTGRWVADNPHAPWQKDPDTDIEYRFICYSRK